MRKPRNLQELPRATGTSHKRPVETVKLREAFWQADSEQADIRAYSQWAQDENYQWLAARSSLSKPRRKSMLENVLSVEYLHRTPSLINKAKETISRSFITNPRKRRQTTDLEWGSDLSAFLKVEKSEWISLNQPELKPRRITQEPRLLQPQPQPPYFPFNGSQSLSSEATCTVLPAICGTAFPSMKFVSAVTDRNRERRKSGLLTESILEKLQLNEKPVRGSYGSYLRAPEATIIVAEGGLSTEPTLLLSEPSTANASKESNALQTPLEVSQMATAKPPKSNHVLMVRENSEDTEKKPSRAMSSSAVPTAGYSTLFLGSDIALKEGFSEPTGQPPPWFPKRPRRLTADTQLGVLLRPAVPAGQPHVPPSFMIASRATADSRTSLPTNQSASKLAAHVKSRSSLQAFLPTTKPRQARLPSLTVQSKGFLPTDSLHLDVRLQAAVPASPTTEVPGGVTVERSPEQKENEDIPELQRRISNFEQTATESTVLRSLSLEVALTTDQLEGLNTLYLSQPATVVFPPLQMSESVEGSLSADAARERLNFINRLKHQHTKSQFDILTGPALTRQSEDFNDAVSAVVELGDTWKQMVFLSRTAAEYSKAMHLRVPENTVRPSFFDIRKIKLAATLPSVEMTADLVGLINKNGEYVQTVLLPRCDEQLNLVKELQSCVASIAELRPKTINPTKIVQLLGMSLGSREERTVLPGGLTEDEYKRRLKSRLLVLVPRLYMRRNTTLDMATSLVTRLCDVAAKVTAYLIGCEHTSAAMGYRNLTIDVLFDGLLTGAVFGTPLAGNSGISLSKNAKAPHGTAGPWIRAPGLESGLPSRTGPSQNSGIALTDALGRLLGSSGQVQEEALRQILQAVIGELGSSSQLISMLGSEVLTGGDVDADTLRRLLQSGRGEDVIQRLVDSLESQEDMLAPAGAQAALLRQLLMSLGAQEDRTESKTTSLNRLTSARGEDMDLPTGVGDSRGSLPGIPAGEDSDSMGLKVRFEEGDSTPDGTGDGTARIIREGSFQPNRQTAEGIDDTSEDTRHGSLLSAASREGSAKNLSESDRLRSVMSDNLPQVSRDSDYSVRTRLRTLFETSGSGMRGLEGILEAFEDDEEALSTILDAVRGEENGVRNLLATLEGKDESLVSDLISRFSGDVDGLRDLILTGMHPDQTQNTGDADQTLQHNLQADYSMKGAIQSSSDADDAGNQDHKEVENVPKVAPTGLPDVIGGIAESAIGGDILSAAALLMTTDAIADDNKGGLANLRKAFRSGAEAKDLLSEVSAYVGENSDVAVRSLLNLVGGPNVDSFFQLLDTSSQPSVFFQQVLNMLGSGVGAVGLEKLLKMLSGGNQLSVPVISSLLERFGLEELLSVLRDNDPSGGDPMAALVAAVGGGANFSRLLDSLGSGREAALERLIAVSGGGEAGLRSLIAAVGDTESLVAGCGDDGASALEMLIRVAGGGEIGMSNLLAAAHSSDADPLGAFIHLLGGGETGLQSLIEIAGGGEAGLTAIINVAGAHHGAKGQDRREAGLLKLVRSLCAGDKVLDVLLNAVAASAGEQTDAPTKALVSLVNAVGGGRNGLHRLLKTAGAGRDPAGGRRTRDIQRLVMAAGGTSEALNVLGTLAGGGGVGLKTLISICEPEDEENMQSLFEEVLVAAGLDKNLAEALPSDADGLAAYIDEAASQMKRERLTVQMFGNRDISMLEREWRLGLPSRSEALQKKYEQWERKTRRKRKLEFDEKTKEEESQPSTRRPSSACLVALGRGISRTPPWARNTDEDLIARLQRQLKEKLRKERTRQQMELLRLQQAKDRELELKLRKQQQGTAIWERLRIQKQTADSEFRRAMEETQLAAQAEAHKRREAQACKEPTKTAESRQNQQIPMKQMSEEEQMMAYLASSQGLRESTHQGKPRRLTGLARRRKTAFGSKSVSLEQSDLSYKLSPAFVWSYFDFKASQPDQGSSLSEADRRFIQKIVTLNRPFAKLF